MSSTSQRDSAINLARLNPDKALEQASKINDPWFRAQAFSWVARFTPENPSTIAKQAAKAAGECDDDYKRSSVRAWEIAALAERGCLREAGKSLSEALQVAKGAQPISSRSEAILLLLQAAMTISKEEATAVYEILKKSCPPEEHRRAKRAHRDAQKIITGEATGRSFFW